jgi:hypothetical protein
MKEIVIVGSGPCLNDLTFNQLSQYDTFCLNTSYRCWPSNWYPTYWGAFDFKINGYVKTEISSFFCTPIKKFFMLIQPDGASYKLEIVSFEEPRDLYKFNSKPPLMANCGNSAAIAIQIAYWMGYRKFLLAGIDADYGKASRRYEEKGFEHRAFSKNELKEAHFSENYIKDGENNWGPDPQFMLHTWSYMKRHSQTHNFEILNVCPTSKLKIFPFISLEQDVFSS